MSSQQASAAAQAAIQQKHQQQQQQLLNAQAYHQAQQKVVKSLLYSQKQQQSQNTVNQSNAVGQQTFYPPQEGYQHNQSQQVQNEMYNLQAASNYAQQQIQKQQQTQQVPLIATQTNAQKAKQRSGINQLNERLLSVVLECNTEHQDPSRVTNQEDSEMGAISQINADAQKNNQDENFLNKRYSHQIVDDSLEKRVAQMGNSAKCKMKEGNEEDERLGYMANHKHVVFRGDETPEEKLKYARLQTEGYQDDGFQDSEDVSAFKNGEEPQFQYGNEDDDEDSENEVEEYSAAEDNKFSKYEDEYNVHQQNGDAEQFQQQNNQPQNPPGGNQGAQGQGQGEAHQMVDLNNYKGIYFDDENEKYQCPETGAHFKFEDLCARMEQIRIKRGDPLIEFDARGNKIHVKSVALAQQQQQVEKQQHHQGGSQRKDSSSNTRSHLTTDQKAIENKRKPTNDSTSSQQKFKASTKKGGQQPGAIQQSSQQQTHQQQQQQQHLHQQLTASQALQLQKRDSASLEPPQVNTGSETVRITGSLLAHHEGATAALQASRNAKLGSNSNQQQHTSSQQMLLSDSIGIVAEEGQLSQDQHRKQLVNVFGAVAQKESRNKNRIHNPQVTKNSMNSNTLEKLTGSAHKLHKQTMVQPHHGRNTNLGALLNPAQVKSQSSLIDSANKRDAKSKLFGGKKSNQQQFSLSKKASGVSHPELMQTTSATHLRSKKTIGMANGGVLSGSQTITAGWTSSVLDNHGQFMNRTQHFNGGPAGNQHHLHQQSIDARGLSNQKASFSQGQHQQQQMTSSTRHLQTEIFESLQTEHSAVRRHESSSGKVGNHQQSSKGIKVKNNSLNNQSNHHLRNSNAHLIERANGSIMTTKSGKLASTKGNKASQDGTSNHISVQDSRVTKGHSRKVNTLQDNMQFIKELQKTKSLKNLQNQLQDNSVTGGGHLGMSKKHGMHHPASKSYADNIKQIAGKSLVQSGAGGAAAHQYSNMSAKILIGQTGSGTTGHSKKISKAEISNVNSKFLAGVKGTQGGPSAMIQTMKTNHASLYGNTQVSKSGEGNVPRKLIKSTSHVQIGSMPANGNGTTSESIKASAVSQIANGSSTGGPPGCFKDMQTLHNPASLKTMHKNMSVAQLNQPHLQGSFLNQLQQINTNHTQENIVVSDSAQMLGVEPARPDSKLSQHDRQAQSFSQGKQQQHNQHSHQQMTRHSASGIQQNLQKTISQSKQPSNRKKQQYIQQQQKNPGASTSQTQLKNNGSMNQATFPIANSFVMGGTNQSLTQRIANSKIVGSQVHTGEPNTTAKKGNRKGTEMTILPNESLIQANQSKIDSHRSHNHHRSSTNLVQQQQLQQLNNLQMTANNLIQMSAVAGGGGNHPAAGPGGIVAAEGSTTKSNQQMLQNYQKSVSQVRSSLMTNSKDTGMPQTKSRNPATQISLSQKQGAAILQTLPNNLNTLSTTNMGGPVDLGINGGSTMTLIFNQPNRVSTKSKDGITSKTNQNAIISPSQATVQRMKKQSQNQLQPHSTQEKSSRSLYLGTAASTHHQLSQQTQQKRVVKRSQNIVGGGNNITSSAQPTTSLRKSPSLGMDKLSKNQHASGKQSHSYGMGVAHQKKQQNHSSGNLFIQQQHSQHHQQQQMHSMMQQMKPIVDSSASAASQQQLQQHQQTASASSIGPAGKKSNASPSKKLDQHHHGHHVIAAKSGSKQHSQQQQQQMVTTQQQQHQQNNAALFQNLVLPPTTTQQMQNSNMVVDASGVPTTMQGQGTARSQRLSLKVDQQMQNNI